MADLGDAESLIAEFEHQWRQGRCPEIREFLARVEKHRDPLVLLRELVCLDLEFRWRSAANEADRPRHLLEDYARMLPELGPLTEMPGDLIAEEYRVRCRWGDHPSHDSFTARFRQRATKVVALLRQADREMRLEQDVDAAVPRGAFPASHDAQVIVPFDPDCRLEAGDYLLQELIGAGGMGKVYRARQRSTNSPVAVKYLRKSFLRDPAAVSRFAREAQILSGFQHPGIIRVAGLGQSPSGGYFIAMDLMEGGDLAKRIALGPALLADTQRWMIAACEAVAYSHGRGVIHCDMKPGNLLLDANGGVVVTDFGLAQTIAAGPIPLKSIAGTAPYMAPEQVSPYWGPLTQRTDVYGLGAVLYSLLTGQAPSAARTLTDTLAWVGSGVLVAPPRSICPATPAAFNDICLRCLAKSPDDRFASVVELTRALRSARH